MEFGIGNEGKKCEQTEEAGKMGGCEAGKVRGNEALISKRFIGLNG